MKARRRLPILTIMIFSLLLPLFVTSVKAACSPCNLEVDTNVPASDATIWVRADGGTPFRFNHTYAFPFNTTHTLEVMNTTISGSLTGARYVFKQWLLNGAQWGTSPVIPTPETVVDYTSSSPYGAFEAQFETQYQLSLTFVDPSGLSVNPPTSIALSGPYSVTLTYTNQSVNQYSNQWLSAGVWTVSDATWEGTSVVSGSNCCSGQSIDLTRGSTNHSVKLGAYAATMKLIDNSNNPVSGATVTFTLVNGTSRSLTSDSQGTVTLGRIPQGTYSAHIVYQNQDMGSYTIDASVYPIDTIKLGVGGGVSAPVVSVVVLLTVFGLALFLVLLAIRVRKAPPPPTIS